MVNSALDIRTINALIEMFRHAVALHGGDVTNISITLLKTDDSTAYENFDIEHIDPSPEREAAYWKLADQRFAKRRSRIQAGAGRKNRN